MNFVAAILVGKISYLIPSAAAIREICLQVFSVVLLIKKDLSCLLSTVKGWNKFRTPWSYSFQVVSVC
jgi:hypothetical protein